MSFSNELLSHIKSLENLTQEQKEVIDELIECVEFCKKHWDSGCSYHKAYHCLNNPKIKKYIKDKK